MSKQLPPELKVKVLGIIEASASGWPGIVALVLIVIVFVLAKTWG